VSRGPSTDTTKIKDGDTVTVYLLPSCGDVADNYIYGEVRSIPQATGDCWVIETSIELHYVQNFSRIVKRK